MATIVFNNIRNNRAGENRPTSRPPLQTKVDFATLEIGPEENGACSDVFGLTPADF